MSNITRKKKISGFYFYMMLSLGAIFFINPFHQAYAGIGGERGAKIDDDDIAINARGVVVNQIITILRLKPDAAGEKCIGILSDMHKAQDDLEELEKSDDNPDIALGRDVLASDMEDAVSECGLDAYRLCSTAHDQQNTNQQDPKTGMMLAHLCAALPQGDR